MNVNNASLLVVCSLISDKIFEGMDDLNASMIGFHGLSFFKRKVASWLSVSLSLSLIFFSRDMAFDKAMDNRASYVTQCLNGTIGKKFRNPAFNCAISHRAVSKIP